jgi:hypothetical protein
VNVRNFLWDLNRSKISSTYKNPRLAKPNMYSVLLAFVNSFKQEQNSTLVKISTSVYYVSRYTAKKITASMWLKGTISPNYICPEVICSNKARLTHVMLDKTNLMSLFSFQLVFEILLQPTLGTSPNSLFLGKAACFVTSWLHISSFQFPKLSDQHKNLFTPLPLLFLASSLLDMLLSFGFQRY